MAPPKKDRYVVTHIVTVEPGEKHSSRSIKNGLDFTGPDGTSAALKSVKPLEAPAKAAPKAKAAVAKTKTGGKPKAKKKA